MASSRTSRKQAARSRTQPTSHAPAALLERQLEVGFSRAVQTALNWLDPTFRDADDKPIPPYVQKAAMEFFSKNRPTAHLQGVTPDVPVRDRFLQLMDEISVGDVPEVDEAVTEEDAVAGGPAA